MTSTLASSTRPSGSKAEELYSIASRVPLIKSHSITVPRPITLPLDLHPLPADIAAYFVYPFSLESYVLDPSTPSSSTVETLQRHHTSLLEARQAAQVMRQRELLQRMAPGWDAGQVAPLMPTHSKQQQEAHAEQARKQERENQQLQRSPLDDLADHLSLLNSSTSSQQTSPFP